jgi:spoIIIJ-associated protein
MEWVEITAPTVDEATTRALEQLGVNEADAEIVVVEEPRTGLFGRVKGEARVRARIRPTGPRPKRSRRGRSGRGGAGRDGAQGSNGHGERSDRPARAERPERAERGERPERQGARSGTGAGEGSRSRSRSRGRGGGQTREPARGAVAVKEATESPRRGEDEAMAEAMTLEEQGAIGKTFLEGLMEAFGLPATVEVRLLDEETVELAVDGADLGILVGPRGATLQALQEVTRTAVQARCASRTDRILVDVARYRERRAKALTEFTGTVAAEVLEAGEERRLEPMSPADRKVVHDAATEIEGVETRSEGEDPDRYVVISPA